MKKNLLKTLWPAALWSVIIFILLTIPGEEFPQGPEVPLLDKLIHVFLFGMQVFLWCRFYYRVSTQKTSTNYVLFLLASCIYGFGMEYVQKYYVANRGFEYGDIAADIVGSFAGWLVFRYRIFKTADS